MKNWKKLAAAGLAMIVLLTAVVFAAGEKKDSEKTGSIVNDINNFTLN